MKIAILTMHSARNYGAVLQSYALQFVIEKKFNHSPVILNYISTQRKNSKFFLKVIDRYKHSRLLSLLFVLALLPTRIYSQIVFSRFVKKFLYVDKKKVSDFKQLSKLEFDADIFCVGSDQVWNPHHNDGMDKGFFLAFVPDNKKKISYASSVATSELTDVQKNEMKEMLSSFSNISYREYSSEKIFKDIQLPAEWVLDPTLLLDKDEWHMMASCGRIPSDYLLLYWFGNVDSIIEKTIAVAKEKNLKIVRISTVLRKYPGDEIVEIFPTPQRFIQLFENAGFVITDSFHGTAFSINFNKQFYSYPVKRYDDRFYSLFEMFNVYDRDLREEYAKLSKEDISYSDVNMRLNEMRNKSDEFLKNALKKE